MIFSDLKHFKRRFTSFSPMPIQMRKGITKMDKMEHPALFDGLLLRVQIRARGQGARQDKNSGLVFPKVAFVLDLLVLVLFASDKGALGVAIVHVDNHFVVYVIVLNDFACKEAQVEGFF